MKKILLIVALSLSLGFGNIYADGNHRGGNKGGNKTEQNKSSRPGNSGATTIATIDPAAAEIITAVTSAPATMGITTIVITIPETQTVNRTIISVREMEEDITMTIVPAIMEGIAHPDPV